MNYKVLFVYPNLEMSSMVPQAIAMLSAVLKGDGIETDVFDTTFYDTDKQNANQEKTKIFLVKPFDFNERGISQKTSDMHHDFRQKVEAFQPDLVAVSFVEDTFGLGCSLLAGIRDLGLPVVAGGVLCTYAPELVASCPDVNYIIRGEGEYPLRELCLALAKGRDFRAIANLCRREDGKLLQNPMRPPVDINSLPTADYSIFEEQSLYRPMTGKIYKTIGIETQRGCAFSCGYCCSGGYNRLFKQETGHRFFRRKNMDRFAVELETLVREVAPEFVYFLSDVFLMMTHREWDQFCEIYSQYKFPFFMNTRAETVDADKVRRLEELNCIRGNIGLEHGNEEFRLKVVDRRVSNDKIVKALHLVGESAISTAANNIIGFPTETRELVFDTINLNRQVSQWCDSVSCFIFAPYRGTPLRELAIEHGYLKTESIVEKSVLSCSQLQMPHLPPEELVGLQRTFAFYVRFERERWPEIHLAEKATPEGEAMYARLSEEFRRRFPVG